MPVFLSTKNDDDKSYFEELYKEYRQDMFAAAYDILCNEEDAEDAVSQAFLKIAEKFTKISQIPGQKLRGYFVIVSRRIAKDIYRKEHRIRKAHDISKIDEYSIPDKSELERYGFSELKIAIKELPELYKETLYLRSLGFSSKETARILGISQNAVDKRVSRAKLLLTKILEDDDYGK